MSSKIDTKNFARDLGSDLRSVQEWALELYFTKEALSAKTDAEIKELFDWASQIPESPK